jgi:hypothetical protein
MILKMCCREMGYEVVDYVGWFAIYVCLYACVCNVFYLFSGSFGVYVPVNSKDRYMIEFYSKLGFLELSPGTSSDTTYVGRTF